jgi:hypothetical protein
MLPRDGFQTKPRGRWSIETRSPPARAVLSTETCLVLTALALFAASHLYERR